ncbi:TonB-dependent receptor, partial [bacterium]|nr:TonB-dependent receptor [bacterium]
DGTSTTRLPEVPRTTSYQTPYDISDQDAFRLRLDYGHQINTSISIRNKFYVTELDWQSTGTLLEGVSTQRSRTVVDRTLQFLDDNQRFVGNQLEATFAYSTGSIKHTLLTGLELARQRDDLRLLVTSPGTIDLIDPVEENLLPKQLLLQIPITLAKARTFIYSSYFVNQMVFSEKFKLFTGGRFDVFNYDDRRRDLIGFEGIIPLYEDAEIDRNHERFSPMIGLVVSPGTDLSFYMNAGQAFAPVSILTSGNPKPLQSTQIELGARSSWMNERVNATWSVYRLEMNNILIPDDNGILRETGNQRSQGIELEISAQPTPSWVSLFSYSYTDAELVELRETVVTPLGFFFIDFSGNRPAFVPKHLLNFWMSKEFRTGLGMGAGLRYVSSQFIAENNRFEISDYHTIDASLTYTFRNFRWSLHLKNVTNQQFETRGYGASSVIPANPFAAYSGLEISL